MFVHIRTLYNEASHCYTNSLRINCGIFAVDRCVSLSMSIMLNLLCIINAGTLVPVGINIPFLIRKGAY